MVNCVIKYFNYKNNYTLCLLNVLCVSTFISNIFKGNPACVIHLDKWLSDKTLLQIAKDNALPETAFFIKNKDVVHLRWFTPDIEIDLRGMQLWQQLL